MNAKSISFRLKTVFAASLPGATYHIKRALQERLRTKIEAVVFDPAPPSNTRAEADFEKLQSKYQGVQVGDYYSDEKRWLRAAERCHELIEMWPAYPKDVLEVGCGDGMTGLVLSSFGHSVTLTDMDDWRDK